MLPSSKLPCTLDEGHPGTKHIDAMGGFWISDLAPVVSGTPEYQAGYRDGFYELRTLDATFIPPDYAKGYHDAIKQKVLVNEITVNRARELLGLASYEKEEMPQPEHDAVHNPSHYTFGKYEVMDVLYDWQLEYPLDNVVKYVARSGKKDEAKELEDLEKARFYLNYLIVQKGGVDWKPDTTAEKELIQAIVHTVEYVEGDLTENSLPAKPGWSWFDALVKYAPEEAQKFVDRQTKQLKQSMGYVKGRDNV